MAWDKGEGKMDMANGESELSPLDQIRSVESEMARRVTAARAAADQSLANAHAQAAQRKIDARETGMREGQVLYKESVARAEEEAHSLTAQAQKQAAELRQKSHQRIDSAVRLVVNMVLGRQDEAGDT
jgi:vacuolar-type H+-ATPase subunit H